MEKMIATGRIDMVVETTNFIYVLELKLSNNGGDPNVYDADFTDVDDNK
mgnify:CR=1 FL=1